MDKNIARNCGANKVFVGTNNPRTYFKAIEHHKYGTFMDMVYLDKLKNIIDFLIFLCYNGFDFEIGSDNMTLEFVDKYINSKLEENENYIRYTYYELRVKYNLTEEEIDKLLELSKIRLENMNYQVYFTGAKFVYNNANRVVEDNEYMIAIKE